MAAGPDVTDQALGSVGPARRVWHTPGRRARAPTTGESPGPKRLGLQRRIAPTPPPAMQVLDLPAATQIIQQMMAQADLDKQWCIQVEETLNVTVEEVRKLASNQTAAAASIAGITNDVVRNDESLKENLKEMERQLHVTAGKADEISRAVDMNLRNHVQEVVSDLHMQLGNLSGAVSASAAAAASEPGSSALFGVKLGAVDLQLKELTKQVTETRTAFCQPGAHPPAGAQQGHSQYHQLSPGGGHGYDDHTRRHG